MKQNKLVFALLLGVFSSVMMVSAQKLEVPIGGGGPGGGSGGGNASTTGTTTITTGLGLKDGRVWVWGFRGSGQHGNGIHEYSRTGLSVDYKAPAMVVRSLHDIHAVTGGAYHILAINGDGELWGWGQNLFGEVGCENDSYHKANTYITVPCKVLDNVVQMSVGEYHSVAMDNQGDVYTWGKNLYRTLGTGDTKHRSFPFKVNLQGEHARLIGGAYEGTFAVTREGNVWAWGSNEDYGLGFASPRYADVPMRVPNLKQYAQKIKTIGGGDGWGQALLDDGRVIAWGRAHYTGLKENCKAGISNSPIPQFVPVPPVDRLNMRYIGTLALTKDNEIYTWGLDLSAFYIYGYCPTKRQTHPGTIVNIGTAKESVTYELDTGEVYGVGYNSLGVLNIDGSDGDTGRYDENIKEWPGIRLKDLGDPDDY